MYFSDTTGAQCDAHEPDDGPVRKAEVVAYDPETRSVTILAYGAGSCAPRPKSSADQLSRAETRR
jgi:hypothetical protein